MPLVIHPSTEGDIGFLLYGTLGHSAAAVLPVAVCQACLGEVCVTGHRVSKEDDPAAFLVLAPTSLQVPAQ